MLSNARIVSLFTIIAQVFAFLRTALIAYFFGASGEVDAYNLALAAPTLLSGVISGWLQSGFVGRYIALNHENPEFANTFRVAIGQVVLIIAILLSIVIFIAKAQLTDILVPISGDPRKPMIDIALSIAIWSLVPTVLSDFLGLVLNCHNRFGAAAAAPVLNAIVSALALWLWPLHNLNTLLITLILGWITQLLFMLYAYNRIGLAILLLPKGVIEEVKATLKLAIPTLPSVVLSNGTIVLIQIACSRLGEGAVAVYGYASRLHSALTQILIIGISTVLLPHLASLLSTKQHDEIVRLFWKISRATLLVCLFILSGVVFLGESTVSTLFSRGKFDQTLSNSVWQAWTLLTLSLFPFALATFYAKLFQAMQRPHLLSISSLISLIFTSLMCFAGASTSSITNIVLSPLIAQIFVLTFFTFNFKKFFSTSGIPPQSINAITKCFLIIAPAITSELILRQLLTNTDTLIAFVIRVTTFLFLFILACRLLKATEWIQLNTAQ
ncbi:lipid II flippase MurJ [Chitinivorax sp. B]|uniref:murein biosynthesis integral membrane protein MurJ n=1 Tax=Chitinivorax sp. B TaxID=2502235 RepID=UPI0010F835F0|nr:lipid II flippase MurJ [Chitinivorax sp. B]